MFVSLIAQSGLFAIISGGLALVIGLLFKRRRLTVIVAVLCGALMGLFLVVDSFVYHLYHYHLAGVVWQIIRAGVAFQVLELSWLEWLFAAGIGIVFLLLEIFLVWGMTRLMQRGSLRGHGKSIGYLFFGCLFLSYTLSVSMSRDLGNNNVGRSNDHLIVMESQIIPYYDRIMGFLMPHYTSVGLETRDFGYFQQNDQVTKPLDYPLHALQCAKPKKPLNIVIIMLDAWRFDRLNPVDSPNLYQFSKQAWRFKQNYSGGNATRPGVFSLFYSVPANYWSAMLSQDRGPVFIDQLLKDGYQMGIFRSASLHYPAFDKTIFRKVRPLRIETPGKQSFDRDRRITKDFKRFIDKDINPNKPFFSFVFYDESHNYCESTADYLKPFQPAVKVCSRMLLDRNSNRIPYLNRYRNAIHFDDNLAGEVLDALRQKGVLKNTVVVITADHGEEFNESHLDYWGHASAYTKWQVHTPMVIYWPGQGHQDIDHLTTHYDVVPLLMKKALGCHNPIADYSVGQPMFKAGNRPYFIVNSYIDYAVLRKNRITRIYSAGNYAINYRNGQPIPNATLNIPELQKAWKQLKEYFKDKQ